MAAMSWKRNLAAWLLRRETTVEESETPVLPSRLPAGGEPTGLVQVFRAIQVLETAVSALPVLQLDNRGRSVAPYGIVARPSLDMTRRELVQYLVACLASDGNFFLLRRMAGDMTLGVLPLPPREVTVTDMSRNPETSAIRYSWRGQTFDRTRVIHKKLVVNPTGLRGLGPIGSCRVELEGMGETRDFAANWRDEAGAPSGLLKSDQPLTDADAEQAKKRVMSMRSGTPLVLGKGLEYQRTLLSPEDMQFIESRKFDAIQTARLFGIPSNLMLTGTDGSSLTYQNIEQSWIEFSTYTLAAYADPITEALGELLPDGQNVGLDWDSSRRSDTSTRYKAYATAIGAGFLTVDDVRGMEGLPALDTNDTETKENTNA